MLEHRRTTTQRFMLPRLTRVAAALVTTVGAGLFTTGIVGDPTPASAAGCGPRQISVSPDTGLDNLFQNYGNAGLGKSWTGGDGTTSVALPDGRDLWLFDDSFLGKIRHGRRNRSRTPYLHNAFVLESNGALTTTLYTPGRRPSAYVSPDPKHTFSLGYFPGGALVNGGTLQVLMEEVSFQNIPNHINNYANLGGYIGVFSLPSLSLVGVQPLPSSGIVWTGDVLSDSGYSYIYGTDFGAVYAARVAGTDLTAPWAYYNGRTWTTAVSGSAPIENYVEEVHPSVSKVSGSFGTAYALVSAHSSSNPQVLTASFGCSPVGPFGPQQTIYTPPEPSAYPASDGVITYDPHGHPELSLSSNKLVISYDVDPAVPRGLANPDPSIYRPRFIDVTLQ